MRGVLAIAEPEPTGDPVWDASLAALVTWRLGEGGLPAPTWATDSSRVLPKPLPLLVDPADPIPTLADVPVEFAARGVFAWRDTFASV